MLQSKKIVPVIAVVTLLACLFTTVFMLCPQVLHITPSYSQPDYEALFDPLSVMTVDITVDEEEWAEMLENAINEEYISCDISINGQDFSSVGIRPKGNTSLSTVYSSDSDRYSFKLEFDHYIDGQTCLGLDKFVLNNIQSDSTYMKEYLSYDLMSQMGVPTPLYCFAQINVNGQPWGLYLAVESLEESFAQRNFGSDYGLLYKPDSMEMGGGGQEGERPAMGEMPDRSQMPGKEEMPNMDEMPQMGEPPQGLEEELENGRQKGMGGMGGMGRDSSASLQYIDDDSDSYDTIFDSAVFDITESDKTRLISSLKKLSEGEDLEEVVDVEEVLRYFACNVALVNLDSYLSSMQHNYYLYEKDGQLSMLPWDYNLSFAGFQVGGGESAVNYPIDTAVTGATLEERPILGKLLEQEEYLQLYHEYLQQIVEKFWSPQVISQKIQLLNELIRSYVAEDPTAFYTLEEYDAGVAMLENYITLRAESIQGQLDGTIPSTEEGQQAQQDSLVDASTIDLSVMGQQGGGAGGRGRMGQNSTAENALPTAPTEGGGLAEEQAPEEGAAPSEGTMPEEGATEGGNAPGGMGRPEDIAPEMPENQQEQQGQMQEETNSDPETMPEEPSGFDKARVPGFSQENSGESQSQNRENLIWLGSSLLFLLLALVFVFRYRRKKVS